MDLPDLKQLKKISDACRKAGIKVFECSDFKITLTDAPPPPSNYKRQKALKDGKSPQEFVQGDIMTDTPSAEELLYWSAGGPPPSESS